VESIGSSEADHSHLSTRTIASNGSCMFCGRYKADLTLDRIIRRLQRTGGQGRGRAVLAVL
jgi:hypothetical protein